MSQKRFFHGHRRRAAFFSRSLRRLGMSFGYLFRGLNSTVKASFPDTPALRSSLMLLGKEMKDDGNTNSENPRITAGYTYLGQFIDHDITLDETSDISKRQDARRLQNFRSMRLDLDSVYGQGPSISPYLYNLSDGFGNKFLLGANKPAGSFPGGGAFDLPRNTQSQAPEGDARNQATALIGDPRNDENLVVSQLHLAFLRFHNAVVDHVIANGTAPENAFTEAQKLVRNHYQWIVLHDFCKTIAGDAIVDDVLENGIKCFTQHRLFMPVEFSVAAYRFGHSMIRSTYNFNTSFPNATLKQLFDFVRAPLAPLFANWVIDWRRFFNFGDTSNLNQARKIDTKVSPFLFTLPGQPTGSILEVLTIRNLHRGLALDLPSGQGVARRMNATRLSKAEILQNTTDMERNLLEANDDYLIKRTPLWYYILKEAEVRHAGERLGDVGGRIVVEVFVRMLQEDADSILRQSNWKPTLPSATPNDFKITDLLNMAGVV